MHFDTSIPYFNLVEWYSGGKFVTFRLRLGLYRPLGVSGTIPPLKSAASVPTATGATGLIARCVCFDL
jgi:hypothetical protein